MAKFASADASKQEPLHKKWDITNLVSRWELS